VEQEQKEGVPEQAGVEVEEAAAWEEAEDRAEETVLVQGLVITAFALIVVKKLLIKEAFPALNSSVQSAVRL